MSRGKGKKKSVPQTEVVSFRMKQDALAELDRYVGELQKRTPGARWSRGSAALNLVLQGLSGVRRGK